MRRIAIALSLLLALALGLGLLWYMQGVSKAERDDVIAASGTIEAKSISIAGEVGGRIRELLVDEGDMVKANQLLVRLDDDFILGEIEKAEAAVATAEANLALVKAGARAEDVAEAGALLTQAVAARQGAKTAWENAVSIRNNPQELDAKIDSLAGQLEAASAQVKLAEVNRAVAASNRDAHLWRAGELLDSDEDKTKYAFYSKQYDAANGAIAAAQAYRDGLQRQFEQLVAMRQEPIALDAQVNAARSQYEGSVAAEAAARARLAALEKGATPEAIQSAEAQLALARASLGVLEARRVKMVLVSPIDGLIVRRNIKRGEMATPGSPLLTVANLDPIEVKVYIAERKVGRIRVGQTGRVAVDSYPGEEFPGKVVWISSKAEFTPRNVQTREERVNMVFAVKVRVENPEGKLKPGMPADVWIETSGQGAGPAGAKAATVSIQGPGYPRTR